MTLSTFSATCCGTAFVGFERREFEAHMKTAHKGGVMKRDSKGRPLTTIAPAKGDGFSVPKTWKPAPLTAFEKEWLGATVELADGRVGQVWSGCADRRRGDVAVVAPTGLGHNELVITRTEKLRKIASIRDEEPELFAA